MNLDIASLVAALLVGIGLYGVLARRNAVMALIGAELIVNAGVVLLVVADVRRAGLGEHPLLTGQVGALFAITVAAAEIGLALAVALLLFRVRGSVDLIASAQSEDASVHSEDVGAKSTDAPAGSL